MDDSGDEETVVRETMDFIIGLVELAAPHKEPAIVPDVIRLEDDDKESGDRQKRGTKRKHTDEEKDEPSVSETGDLIAEPPVPLAVSRLKRNSCLICDCPRLEFLAIRNGKFEHLCSQSCVEKFKKFRTQAPCQNCNREIVPGEPAYRPNFGVIGRAVCSQRCLLQYDDQFGPKAKCRNGNCAQAISGKGNRYHWQSMDFCTAACVKKLLRAVGSKCAECRSQVPVSSIGKYSVRFGDVVRQFCNTTCLAAHKKSHRCCYFCQTEVRSTGSTSTSSSNKPVDRDFGEGVKSFCNSVCLDDFMRTDAEKRINRETETTDDLRAGNFCDMCLCYFETQSPDPSPDHMSFKNPCNLEEVVFLCSTVCASAFRYKHRINSLFCSYCYKLDWTLSTGVILRFSDAGVSKLKIFCARRCMNLFVIRVRKLMNCVSCKCCKYTFDLIEEHDVDTGVTTYFCSLICLNVVRESRSLRLKYGSRLEVIKCATCLKVTRAAEFHVTDKYDESVVHSFCSFPCYNQHLKNPPKPPPPPPQPKQRPPEPPAAPQIEAPAPIITRSQVNGTTGTSAVGPAAAALRTLANHSSSATLANSSGTRVATTTVSVPFSVDSILNRTSSTSVTSTATSAISIRESLSNQGLQVFPRRRGRPPRVMTYENMGSRLPVETNFADNNTVNYASSTRQLSLRSDSTNGSQTTSNQPSLQASNVRTYSSSDGKQPRTLTIDVDSPLGQLCLHVREQGLENSDLRGLLQKAQNGGKSNVKEVLVVKEKPKQLVNAAVQVRRGSVTKAIQCKPFLVDAEVNTGTQDE